MTKALFTSREGNPSVRVNLAGGSKPGFTSKIYQVGLPYHPGQLNPKQNRRQEKSSAKNFDCPVCTACYCCSFECYGILLCYLPISRQRQQVEMLNATLEYNKLTSLARMQHVKRESDSRKKLTKK